MNVSIVNPDHGAKLAGSVNSYFGEENYLDLVFVCKDSTLVKAHKIVLSSVSDFLKEMLLTTGESVVFINLPDVENKEVQILLNFLYDGVAKVEVSQIDKFKDILILLRIHLPNADVKLLEAPATDVNNSAQNSGNNTSSSDSRVLQTAETSHQEEKNEEPVRPGKESDIIEIDDDDDEDDYGVDAAECLDVIEANYRGSEAETGVHHLRIENCFSQPANNFEWNAQNNVTELEENQERRTTYFGNIDEGRSKTSEVKDCRKGDSFVKTTESNMGHSNFTRKEDQTNSINFMETSDDVSKNDLLTVEESKIANIFENIFENEKENCNFVETRKVDDLKKIGNNFIEMRDNKDISGSNCKMKEDGKLDKQKYLDSKNLQANSLNGLVYPQYNRERNVIEELITSTLFNNVGRTGKSESSRNWLPNPMHNPSNMQTSDSNVQTDSSKERHVLSDSRNCWQRVGGNHPVNSHVPAQNYGATSEVLRPKNLQQVVDTSPVKISTTPDLPLDLLEGVQETDSRGDPKLEYEKDRRIPYEPFKSIYDKNSEVPYTPELVAKWQGANQDTSLVAEVNMVPQFGMTYSFNHAASRSPGNQMFTHPVWVPPVCDSIPEYGIQERAPEVVNTHSFPERPQPVTNRRVRGFRPGKFPITTFRKRRVTLNEHDIRFLEVVHRQYDHRGKSIKREIAQHLGVTIKAVEKWFKKKVEENLTEDQKYILEMEYKVNEKPDVERQTTLGVKFGVPSSYISKWFTKKRKVVNMRKVANKRYQLTEYQKNILEKVYIKNEFQGPRRQSQLAKQLGISVNRCTKWFEKRKLQDEVITID